MTNILGSSFSLLVARAILKSQLSPKATVELKNYLNINIFIRLEAFPDLQLEIQKATPER